MFEKVLDSLKREMKSNTAKISHSVVDEARVG